MWKLTGVRVFHVVNLCHQVFFFLVEFCEFWMFFCLLNCFPIFVACRMSTMLFLRSNYCCQFSWICVVEHGLGFKMFVQLFLEDVTNSILDIRKWLDCNGMFSCRSCYCNWFGFLDNSNSKGKRREREKGFILDG